MPIKYLYAQVQSVKESVDLSDLLDSVLTYKWRTANSSDKGASSDDLGTGPRIDDPGQITPASRCLT